MIILVLGFLVFFLIGVLAYYATIYNGLIFVKNNVQKAWANIDVLLKQRHDEIPKLIKTCEGSMKYEQETLAKIVALRNSAATASGIAEKAEKENALSAGLRQLFAVSERYPQLKAQASFQQLQARITALEGDIADRREFYNDSVNAYNVRIESMPDCFVARFMGLAPREMFEASADEREDVPVEMQVP